MCKQSTLSACHVGKGAGLAWVADGSSMLCLCSAVPRIAVSFGGMHFNRSHSSCGKMFDLLSEVVISRPQIHRAHHSPHRTTLGRPMTGVTHWDPLDPNATLQADRQSVVFRLQQAAQEAGLRWAQMGSADVSRHVSETLVWTYADLK